MWQPGVFVCTYGLQIAQYLSLMKIAVDFDGTIVQHKYPAIGEEQLFAFDTLKALQRQGHHLILWTFRAGRELQEAVDYCRKNGVEFYAVNQSYPGEQLDADTSRKPDVELFIDDRNFGGFPGWSEVWLALGERRRYSPPDPLEEMYRRLRRRPFFERLKLLFF